MERTMISFNIPNLITINLMAWLGFLVFGALYQAVAKKRSGGTSAGSAPITTGASDIVMVGDGGGY